MIQTTVFVTGYNNASDPLCLAMMTDKAAIVASTCAWDSPNGGGKISVITGCRSHQEPGFGAVIAPHSDISGTLGSQNVPTYQATFSFATAGSLDPGSCK